MGGEIGHMVFDLGEKLVDSFAKGSGKSVEAADKALGGKLGAAYTKDAVTTYEKVGQQAKDRISTFHSLNTLIADPNSKSLAVARDTVSRYARQLDANTAIYSKDLKAQNKSAPMHEIKGMAAGGDPNVIPAKGAPRGFTTSTGQFVPGARDSVAGINDHNLVSLAAAIADEHGEDRAKNVMDAFSSYFHEQQGGVAGYHGTRLVSNLKTAPATKDIAWKASSYERPTDLERKIHGGMGPVMTVKSGLRHVSTPFNILLGSSLDAIGKTMGHAFGDGYKNARAQCEFYNVMGETMARELDQEYKFQHGLISKFLPGSFGEFVHNNIGIPGFNALRNLTLNVSAMQGKYIGEEMASNLFSKDPALINRAMLELKYLGIDGNQVLARNGQLHKSPFGETLLNYGEIQSAMFENANHRVFIDTGRYRSRIATNSFYGRMISMYHNYASQQGNFLLREFVRAYKSKDPARITKDIVILGTVFPAVGAGLNSLASIWMGKDPKTVKADLEKFLDPTDFWSKVEAFSHTAGFGIMNSYMRATSRNKLANALLGPAINLGVETAQDVYKAGKAELTPEGREKERAKGPYQVPGYAPLARDVLHDIPSLGIGAVISAHMFPTQQQLQQERPMTAKRAAAQRGAARRKELKKIRGY